jgi:putative peptidoglycan lipid II flippase
MLVWLALGLPAHVLVKALSPAFFARDDTLTPVLATLKALAVAIVLAIVFGQISGATGIAAGIACGAWSNALALIRSGAATFGFSIDAGARRRLPRILAAALTLGGLLWLTVWLVPARDAHSLAQALLLLLVISCAIVVYGLLLAWFGVIRWADAVKAVRQAATSDLREPGPRGN